MPTPRPLRRLRRALAFVAATTALSIAAACRLEAVGRTVATVVAIAGLAAWVLLLDMEGRAAERLEARVPRRATPRRADRTTARRGAAGTRRRRAA